jgi:tetratricopeptide (TPR) repeat protein
MLEFADRHFDGAEQLFTQALARDPTHQTAYVQLRNIYVKQGKFGAALHVLGSALMLKPRDARTLFNLGLAHNGLGQHEQAVAAFKKSLELAPSSEAAQYNLGTLLLKVGDVRGALPPLHKAIRLNPQFSDALYNLAAAYALSGERDHALQWLQQVIQLNRSLASEAQRDEDFRSLRSDPDFVAMTQPS